jgi:hypothetical protein
LGVWASAGPDGTAGSRRAAAERVHPDPWRREREGEGGREVGREVERGREREGGREGEKERKTETER